MITELYRKEQKSILSDLEKKMVFIVGPRQVGKTWLAKKIAQKFSRVSYLNYDFLKDRETIQRMEWDLDLDLLIFDELHKMKGWKNFLKGVYDKKPENMRILVTGSARLETFRKTGDSLAGRFFVYRLMPFCFNDVSIKQNMEVGHFMKRGGFPEPLLANKDFEADKWRKNYLDSLLRDDVFSLRKIVDIKLLENILMILQRKVGSPISYSSIARDVLTSHNTVKQYIELLESLYVIFSIPTYSRKISRAILKEKKIYFFDTGLVVGDDGLKFENFIAGCLLKQCLWKNDQRGENNKLMYLRDKESREVDFVLVENDDEVKQIIETKLSDDSLSKSLLYFKEKYNFSATQVVKNLHTEKEIRGIKIIKAENFLKNK